MRSKIKTKMSPISQQSCNKSSREQVKRILLHSHNTQRIVWCFFYLNCNCRWILQSGSFYEKIWNGEKFFILLMWNKFAHVSAMTFNKNFLFAAFEMSKLYAFEAHENIYASSSLEHMAKGVRNCYENLIKNSFPVQRYF